MLKLIENAKDQFKNFGKVIVTTYEDRTYGANEHVFRKLEEAISFIEDFPIYAGEEEDIYVPNAMAL